MGVVILAAVMEGITPGLIACGVALLFLSLILPRMAARKKASSAAPPMLSRERGQEMQRTLDEVFLQLQEFSRETMGKLDTRIRMLNQLVVDADERIRKLQSLPPIPPTIAAAAAPAPPPAPTNPLHERIYRLLDKGTSLGEVARDVGLPKGEVELIAGLRALPRREA